MENKYSEMTENEFYLKYIELINKGFSDDSPEMIELFKARSLYKSASTTQSPQYNSNVTRVRAKSYSQPRTTYQGNAKPRYTQPKSNNSRNRPQARVRTKPYYKKTSQTSIHETPMYKRPQSQTARSKQSAYNRFNENQKINFKSHIIIDSHGNYTLLDSNLNAIDTMQSNPIFTFLTGKIKLNRFKKQLKMDKKDYIRNCKLKRISPNKDFLEMHKKIKFYLKICPDADYQILELLRNNITKINPYYYNYQTACAEYLYELAQYRDGDASNLPFDINFSYDYDEFNTTKHKYISEMFDKSDNPVETFKKIYSHSYEPSSDFHSRINYDGATFHPKFKNARIVKTTINQDR